MRVADDDLDEIMNLESDKDDTSADDKPCSKSELGPSSRPGPRPTTKKLFY